MDVRLRALAVADVDDAVDHHRDEAGEQVALAFVSDLESSVAVLSEQPRIGSLRFAYELEIPELRSWPLRQLPYLVFYVTGAEHVDVWRVLHARRDLRAILTGDDGPDVPPR